MDYSYIIKSYSIHNTNNISNILCEIIDKKFLLLLNGDVGCGKSTIARKIIKNLISNQTIVPSPTYTIVEEYKKNDLIIKHADLYRINSEEEIDVIGLYENIENSISIVEWPELLNKDLYQNIININCTKKHNVHIFEIVFHKEKFFQIFKQKYENINNDINNVFLFAAGFGKRMLPITLETPKPLIKINEKPQIEYTIDMYKNHNVKFFVNAHHLYLKIIEYFKNRKNFTTIHEQNNIETGGAIINIFNDLSNNIFTSNCDSIIIPHNSDDIINIMKKSFDKKTMGALLLVTPIENTSGYEGKGDFILNEDGSLSYPENPNDANCVYIGTQIINKNMVKLYKPNDIKFSLSGIFKKLEQNENLFGLSLNCKWFHVSKPDDIDKTNLKIKNILTN